jgi:hypothetical protein
VELPTLTSSGCFLLRQIRVSDDQTIIRSSLNNLKCQEIRVSLPSHVGSLVPLKTDNLKLDPFQKKKKTEVDHLDGLCRQISSDKSHSMSPSKTFLHKHWTICVLADD